MTVERTRGVAARVGVAALNLVLPGLGLVRAGRGRAALVFLLAPYPLLAGMAFWAVHVPIGSYRQAVLTLAAILGVGLAICLGAISMTWVASRHVAKPAPWSRWYGLSATVLASVAAGGAAEALLHRFVRPFHTPAESMAPTLIVGDKFIADMRRRGPFRRGEIIVIQSDDGMRVSRVAAGPGDRIALRAGVPIVNGVAAVQRVVRRGGAETAGPRPATLLTERLPGERAAHRILDIGPSPSDDIAETIVPARHLYLLGDNRDASADSRFGPEQMGVGFVPVTAVLGRPIYIHWSRDRARIGARLDR